MADYIAVRFGLYARGKYHIAARLPRSLSGWTTLCGREPEGRSIVTTDSPLLRVVYGDEARDHLCKRCLAVSDSILDQVERAER